MSMTSNLLIYLLLIDYKLQFIFIKNIFNIIW